MRYDFSCDHCGHFFEAKVPIGTKLTSCPECQEETAHKVFNPRAISITTTFSNRPVTRYQELHGFDSTGEHSANYLFHQKDEAHQNELYSALAAHKPRKTITERMLEKYPDTDLNKPFTQKDSQELRQLLAQGPPCPKAN